MKIYTLVLAALISGAYSLKEGAAADANLKTQTLMFAQKYKVTQDKMDAIITLSYLNPILDKASGEDIFALTTTPDTLKVENLEISINERKANIEELDEEFFKYLIQNRYTCYLKTALPNIKKEDEIIARICLNHLPCFGLNFQKYPESLYYHSEDVDT